MIGNSGRKANSKRLILPYEGDEIPVEDSEEPQIYK